MNAKIINSDIRMNKEKAAKHGIATTISSKITALFINEPAAAQTIFLCKMNDSLFRRLKLACEMATEGKNVSIVRVDTAETLISESVRKNDIVIVDPLTTQEFLVNHVLRLIEEKPKIIWADSQKKLSISKTVDDIKSIIVA